MANPSVSPAAGFTAGWSKINEPVPTRRRNPATQEAYDFFLELALETVVLIPSESEKVARGAARQFMKERPNFKIGFQPGKDGLKAWKQEVAQKAATAPTEDAPAPAPTEAAPAAEPAPAEESAAREE